MEESASRNDEIVMKIIHYFITEQDYKPIIVSGIRNEVWLENFKSNPKLIRININYIHNDLQYQNDLRKAEIIMKNIKKKTYSLKMSMLNILIDVGDNVNKIQSTKNIDSIKVKRITDLKKNNVVISYFPTIKNKIFTKKAGIQEMIKMTNDMNEKTQKDEKKLSRIFKESKPTITYSLLGINILIYILMLIPNIYLYALNNFSSYFVYVKNGEIYRLFTSMFIHANIYHLTFNMYALYLLGREVERYYGKTKFLIIYLLSGIFGSLLSCVLNISASIGASGAIFGLLGSLLYFSFEYRAVLDRYLKGQIIPVIVMNLLLSLIIPSIDLFGHIGGLIGGVLASMIVGIKDKDKKLDRINGLIISTILIIFLWFLLLQK